MRRGVKRIHLLAQKRYAHLQSKYLELFGKLGRRQSELKHKASSAVPDKVILTLELGESLLHPLNFTSRRHTAFVEYRRNAAKVAEGGAV